MKRFGIMFAGFLVIVIACHQVNDTFTNLQQAPTKIVALAPCETGYSGVLLKASGYKYSGGWAQFVYYIYPQKDTLGSDLTVKGWANASGDNIIIPDSVIAASPKFVVMVEMNSDGKLLRTPYTSFVKRSISHSYCYLWAAQTP